MTCSQKLKKLAWHALPDANRAIKHLQRHERLVAAAQEQLSEDGQQRPVPDVKEPDLIKKHRLRGVCVCANPQCAVHNVKQNRDTHVACLSIFTKGVSSLLGYEYSSWGAFAPGIRSAKRVGVPIQTDDHEYYVHGTRSHLNDVLEAVAYVACSQN